MLELPKRGAEMWATEAGGMLQMVERKIEEVENMADEPGRHLETTAKSPRNAESRAEEAERRAKEAERRAEEAVQWGRGAEEQGREAEKRAEEARRMLEKAANMVYTGC